MNVTRTAWLSHGGDPSTVCTTIDLQSGSSQQAINLGYSLIASGIDDAVLACGVEAMSVVPMGSSVVNGPGRLISRSYYQHYPYLSQFQSAERVAGAYGVSRADADELGLESQIRAAAVQREGRFESQIVPVAADPARTTPTAAPSH